MHEFLTRCGIPEEELAWFGEHATPPQILGINYYVLSDRFLDDTAPMAHDSLEGDKRHRYREVEAARLCGIIGVGKLLTQAWERFQLPLAVSEAHLAGPTDEQYRWLVSMWDGICAAARAGADVRALTVWSLFGTWDWDSLCTTCGEHYEPGVFDTRGRSPQLTELAQALRPLMHGVRPVHHALNTKGWWTHEVGRTAQSPLSDAVFRAPHENPEGTRTVSRPRPSPRWPSPSRQPHRVFQGHARRPPDRGS